MKYVVLCFCVLLGAASFGTADTSRVSRPVDRSISVPVKQPAPHFWHEDVDNVGRAAGVSAFCAEDFECADEGSHSTLPYEQCGITVTLQGVGGSFSIVDPEGLVPNGVLSFGDRVLVADGCLGDLPPHINVGFSSPLSQVVFSHMSTGYVCCFVSGIAASFCSDVGHMVTGFGTGTNRIESCALYGDSIWDNFKIALDE